MKSVGRGVEIWRYRISSVGGERVCGAIVRPDGVVGDRQYGLVEAATGKPAAPENNPKWRKALHLTAGTLQEAPPILTFPDGRTCSLGDRALNDMLTEYFGFEVVMAAYEHAPWRLSFRLTKYRHPHFPLHVLTTSSLERLAALGQKDAVDSRRFRPSVVIEVEKGHGFVENDWIGRRLRLGRIDAMAEEATKRCGITFVSQPGLDEDAEILRSILRNNKRHLGVYCSTDAYGTIELSDEVFFES